ncbi:MAG TPA: hypothetical protein VMB46_09515 [Methanomassiliicoccales archaeon]|nr:hypothetical protein [Methanomassiliicoccales archaeon]
MVGLKPSLDIEICREGDGLARLKEQMTIDESSFSVGHPPSEEVGPTASLALDADGLRGKLHHHLNDEDLGRFDVRGRSQAGGRLHGTARRFVRHRTNGREALLRDRKEDQQNNDAGRASHPGLKRQRVPKTRTATFSLFKCS